MLVSVIMPTYNCGKYILQSLDSVIAQTVTDWEVQIVDDCSTDNTAEVLKPYLEKYPNIHYYVLPQNGGPAVARTEAMKRATGKYIAFLDSDDLWKPDKLEKQIAFMEKTGAKFSATGYQKPARVIVSQKRTLEAAAPYAYAGKKVCIWNFASATNPGGGVTKGSSAQEEAICRCSTLYANLKEQYAWNAFYAPHRRAHDPLHNDDCTCFTDTSTNQRIRSWWTDFAQRPEPRGARLPIRRKLCQCLAR